MANKLRKYYDTQIIEYLAGQRITFTYFCSRRSDYYYIKNIKGKNGYTLKLRVSDHPVTKEDEIPFLKFNYSKPGNTPGKKKIGQIIDNYIAKYREE